jgi:hypothetical protein
MISKYNSFLSELLLERAINESILYYSPDLRKIINKIDSDIALDLRRSETSDIKPDVTFVDLDQEGYLSFSTMRNAKKNIIDKFPHLDYVDTKVDKDLADELFDLDKRGSSRASGVSTKSRSQIGIGKFINKLFPGKYNDKQREDFVNSFKAALVKVAEKFEVVEGVDIGFWYNSKNYAQVSGTLGSSCMAEKNSSIFRIYEMNPEVCKMLILKEDDKILGRALVWKLTSIRSLGKPVEGIEYFMDRQYTIKDSDVQKFRNYAKEQGWCYKSYNNHHSCETVNIEGVDKNVGMTVKVKPFKVSGVIEDYDYVRYPYMDTFRRYNPNDGYFYNDSDTDENEGQYILDSTSGDYNEIEGGVYSEWYDRRIPEDEAVYSDRLGDYLLRDSAVEVTMGNRRHRGWYPSDYDDIVFDESIDEYLHADDTVYSDAKGYHIFEENAVKVINKVYSHGSIEDADDADWYYDEDSNITRIDESSYWFEKLSARWNEWDSYSYILKSIMTKDYNNKWIPKTISTNVYLATEPNKDNSIDLMGIEYLTEVDAFLLGYDIDKNDVRLIDKFSYQLNLEQIIKPLTLRYKSESIKLRDILSNKGQLKLELGFEDEEEYKVEIKKRLLRLSSRLEELEDGSWS